MFVMRLILRAGMITDSANFMWGSKQIPFDIILKSPLKQFKICYQKYGLIWPSGVRKIGQKNRKFWILQYAVELIEVLNKRRNIFCHENVSQTYTI